MKKHTFCQILFSITAFLPLFQTGVWRGYISAVIPKFQAEETPIPMTLNDLSWMAALADIGGFFSPFPVGYMMDRLGRLIVLRIAFISYLSASTLILVATSPYHIYLASFASGLGFGVAFATPILYVSEIAKPKIRGSLGSVGIVMFLAGTAVIMTFGPYISFRYLCWVTLVTPLVGFFLTFFMVESPYYYFIQNDEESAVRALSRVRNDTKIIEKDVELASIRKRVDDDLTDESNFFELITQKGNRKAFVIVMVLSVVRSGGGFICVTLYSLVSLPSDSFWDPKISMMAFSWLVVAAGFSGVNLVDRFGRKPLMLVSSVGVCVSTTILAVFYYFHQNTDVDVTRFMFVPHVAVMLFGVFTPFGMSIVPDILRGELFSVRIKGPASAIAVMLQSATLFINNKMYFLVDQSVGVYFMYVIFSVVNFFSAVFTALYVFETKGKTLAEIQDLLKRKYDDLNQQEV